MTVSTLRAPGPPSAVTSRTPSATDVAARARGVASAYAALAFGLVGLGCSAIFVKWANAPGAVSGAYRVAIAAAALAIPFSLEVKRQRARLSARHVGYAVLAGLFFAGDLAAWNTALLVTSAASSTMLANTSPLWVGIGSLLFFRRRLRRRFWLGLAVAFTGSAIILGADAFATRDAGVGSLLSLLAGLFYAGYFLAAERARQALTSLQAWWIATTASAGGLVALAVLSGQPLTGYPPITYWNLATVALVTQVGAYLAISYALGHLPAAIVSPTLLGQPVLTAALAVPLLGQPITIPQIIGGAIVIAGIRVVHTSKPA